MKVYINGIGCISAQKTFDSVFPEGLKLNDTDNFFPIQPPLYKDYISPTTSRRMAKGVKNGIVAAAIAAKEANSENFDAIITGTGMGCIEDSDKFLRAIIDNKEEFLTPTSFIQSTHNTVGAQIALGLQCKSYNFTYVNGAVSFESALLDARLQLEANETSAILIGGIDEMTEYTQSLFNLAGIIKSDVNSADNILTSESKGAIFSEGATFFVLENQKQVSSYAEVLDVLIVNRVGIDKVYDKTIEFLNQNGIEAAEIDAVILGINGDSEYDGYYHSLRNSFQNVSQVYYKHLSGEYNTASAFGLYIGANLLKIQQIPDILKVNAVTKPAYKKILLYNQYRGIDHSFILISQC